MTRDPGTADARCAACGVLSDHESYDDPFDGESEWSPENRDTIAAIRRLVRVPNQPNCGNSRIMRCTACGALYYYAHAFIPFSDHDTLDVQRLTAEETRVLSPLLNTPTEVDLSQALAEVMSSERERVREWAGYILECIIRKQLSDSGVVLVLARLLSDSRGTVRRAVAIRLKKEAWGKRDISAAIPGLMAALEDDDPAVRTACAEALTRHYLNKRDWQRIRELSDTREPRACLGICSALHFYLVCSYRQSKDRKKTALVPVFLQLLSTLFAATEDVKRQAVNLFPPAVLRQWASEHKSDAGMILDLLAESGVDRSRDDVRRLARACEKTLSEGPET